MRLLFLIFPTIQWKFSELIVPSNHSVPNRHDTSQEISRILFLHLKNENILRPSEDAKPRLARSSHSNP